METNDSFCAVGNRMDINLISPIYSGIRAGGMSKSGIDDIDRMFFSSTPLCVGGIERCAQMPKRLIAYVSSRFFSL